MSSSASEAPDAARQSEQQLNVQSLQAVFSQCSDPAAELNSHYAAVKLEASAELPTGPTVKGASDHSDHTDPAREPECVDLCNICEKQPPKPKKKQCGICAVDVQAARGDAVQAGKLQMFLELQKAGAAKFQDFMHEYIKANPQRRKYLQRMKFDWIRLEESLKLQQQLRCGYKALLMDKEEAVTQWTEKKGMCRQDALAKWDVEVASARYSDNEGRDKSKRIPVKVEDFIVGEDSLVNERAMTKGFKQCKWTEQEDQEMKQAIMESTMDVGAVAGVASGMENFVPAAFADGLIGARARKAPARPAMLVSDAGAGQEEQLTPSSKKRKVFDSEGAKTNLECNSLTQLLKAGGKGRAGRVCGLTGLGGLQVA